MTQSYFACCVCELCVRVCEGTSLNPNHKTHTRTHARTHTHTHTCLMALCPGLPKSASTRKAKPIWILLEQETVSGSGIRWAICKSALRSRQITTPAPHYSSFLQARCPSCHPTKSVKPLKANPNHKNEGNSLNPNHTRGHFS